MQPSRHLVLLLAAGASTGCVLSPTDDGAVSSRVEPLVMNGYAGAASDDLLIRAWNYERGAWELVGSVRSSPTPLDSTHSLYRWAVSPRLGERYWSARNESCHAPGQARLQVLERYQQSWVALKTFDVTGQACLNRAIAEHVDYVQAGSDCETGDVVVARAPDGCVSTDFGSPFLFTDVWGTLTATDDVTVWDGIWGFEPYDHGPLGAPAPNGHIVAPGRPLRLRADAFGTHGLGSVRLNYTVELVCRTASGLLRYGGFEQTLTRSTTEPVGDDTVGRGTLGVAVDLDAATLRPYCPAGTTLRQAVVFASARGTLGAGMRGADPRLFIEGNAFTMTF